MSTWYRGPRLIDAYPAYYGRTAILSAIDLPHIAVIVGKRPGRFGEKAAAWIAGRLAARDDLTVELVDCATIRSPFTRRPGLRLYQTGLSHPDVARWAKKVDDADGYVIVTPKYNHGYPAALKNALDYAFVERRRKPVAFVGYGGVGGARAIEQLRQVVIELEMAPLRYAVHILADVMRAATGTPAPVDGSIFASLDPRADMLAEDLSWWARTLARGRAHQQ